MYICKYLFKYTYRYMYMCICQDLASDAEAKLKSS